MTKHIPFAAYAVLWAASAAAQTPSGTARPAPTQPQTAQPSTRLGSAAASTAGCAQLAAAYPRIDCNSGKPVTTGATLIVPEAYDYVPTRSR
jgi:hypothetical protein